MEVFSQYNIQIYCSTLACLVSIVLAIIPSQVRVTKKTKVFFVFLPLFINLLQAIYIIVDVYLNGVDRTSEKWIEQEFIHFIEETGIESFIWHILIISILSMVVMFIVISVMKKASFNDKQLMRYYLKLTNEQRDSGHIVIIGGSMDFLGVCPCKTMTSKSFECKNTYYKLTDRWFSEKKCKKCCLNNEQWKQLSKLICRGCRVQIVCAHPNNTEQATQTKALIGFILKSWKKDDNVKISFFSADDDPNLRGRIIEDYTKTKRVCWNFKTSNKKKNSYEMPHTYSENDRLGALIIEAFDKIQASGQKMTQNEEDSCIQAFGKRT